MLAGSSSWLSHSCPSALGRSTKLDQREYQGTLAELLQRFIELYTLDDQPEHGYNSKREASWTSAYGNPSEDEKSGAEVFGPAGAPNPAPKTCSGHRI
jgi:uncharacterized protein (UPF0332 family)